MKKTLHSELSELISPGRNFKPLVMIVPVDVCEAMGYDPNDFERVPDLDDEEDERHNTERPEPV